MWSAVSLGNHLLREWYDLLAMKLLAETQVVKPRLVGFSDRFLTGTGDPVDAYHRIHIILVVEVRVALTLSNHLIQPFDPEFETPTVDVDDREDLDAVVLWGDADGRENLLDQLTDH